MFREIAGRSDLTNLTVFDGYPPASDRKAWERVPESYRMELIREGERWLGYGYPPIYASDYMEFCRTGNRSRFEEKQFQRRTVLNALVMAECAEYEGRFLDDIINGIVLICEEAAWQLPAHNTYVRDAPQHILPDVTRPVIDLFAAETGAVVGMAEYLLRDALKAVSPVISKMVDHSLEIRVFGPYLKEHFWWMGDGKSSMNNWTSWCTQNVLTAAFTRAAVPAAGREIIGKACESLDYFLAEYGEDGCCDEGAQYYRHAGLTLFNAMEVLNDVCGGIFGELYKEKKIANMADYIRRVHVAGPYYVNFADCSPKAGPCRAREYLFGKRTGNGELMAFAAEDYRRCEDKLDLQEHNLMYRVQAAFAHEEMTEYGNGWGEEKAGESKRGEDWYFPSAGLFIARDERFCLAVKAGDNGDSHNHNDVGSFTVYCDGRPLFIDVGVESYTKKTFSPKRYEIWTMQSRYHNLPTFGGVMERDGKQFGAGQVEYELGREKSWISMELIGAYETCFVSSYRRRACLEKGRCVRITDRWEGDGSGEDVVLSLMTCVRPETVQREGELWMHVADMGVCRIAGGGAAVTEEIPVTDPRLKTAWEHSIFQTLVTFGGREMTLTVSGGR